MAYSIRCFGLLQAVLVFFGATAAMAQEEAGVNAGGPVSAVYADTFLIQPVRTKIILPVRIRGKAYKFLLDTGAPLMVSKELAAILRTKDIARGVLTDQSGLRDSINFIRTDTIRIGHTDYAGVPALVMENTQPALACLGVDGIIGSNMLRNSAVSYDVTAGRLVISGGRLPEQEVKGIPMKLDKQSNPFIEVHAHKAKSQVLFDSGDDSFFEIDDKALPEWIKAAKTMAVIREGYGATSMGFNGMQNPTKQHLIMAGDFRIGGQTFDSVAAVSTTGGTRIGAALLNFGKVTVDYAGGKFYFAPYPDVKLNFVEGKWDISGIPDGGKMKVITIWNKTLASEAGISIGDEITAIDDRPAAQVTFCDLITGKPFGDATALRMSIRTAGGKIKTVTVRKTL